jgi:VIT1/CCC1 family predicted Fe2+/Mn2+ transporter
MVMRNDLAVPRERLEHNHSSAEIQARLAQHASGNHLRDWIYGGIDGTITTFAIVAGVVGADLPGTVVLVLGLANLIADGFAMGAGNYSATKAELDDYQRLLAIERKHIAVEPSGEREEIRQIFGLKGFSGPELERIVDVITADEELWARTMAVEEYGLSPAAKSPILAALNTSAAFVACGLVPLGSYLIGYSLLWCVVATGLVFFGIGAAKSRWSLAGWGRSGLETLLIGMSAAGLSFLIGYGLRTFVKVPV